MNNFRLHLLFFASILSFLCACYSVPVTGRSQFNMMSLQSEDAMGEQYYQEVLKKEKLSANKNYSNAVSRITSAIIPHTESQFNWKISTIENDQANAFCVPGGKIVVYDGLSNYTKNEAELAAVIGHEMAHAVARHSGEGQSRGAIVELGAVALNVVGYSEWNDVYNAGSQIGIALPFSRKQEYEADYIGTVFMAKAGYDPRATISFWQKLKGDDTAIAAFFSTHPCGQDRIDELNKNMPIFMDYYQKAPIKREFGTSFSPTLAAKTSTSTPNVKTINIQKQKSAMPSRFSPIKRTPRR